MEQNSTIHTKGTWTEENLLSRCPFSSSTCSCLLWDVAQIMSKDTLIWPYSDPNQSKQHNIHRGSTSPLDVHNRSERMLSPTSRWRQGEETFIFEV